MPFSQLQHLVDRFLLQFLDPLFLQGNLQSRDEEGPWGAEELSLFLSWVYPSGLVPCWGVVVALEEVVSPQEHPLKVLATPNLMLE
jgi:hypothetical protein